MPFLIFSVARWLFDDCYFYFDQIIIEQMAFLFLSLPICCLALSIALDVPFEK
jgi:hypothetical protein